MKRVVIVGILLTVLLPMGIVEGSSATEPLVFSVLYNEEAATPFQEDWLILDEYAKRQDVVLDVRLASNEDYEHAIIRAIESGNIPDIVLKVWPDTIESYATTGILLAFSDYEHLMPHFEAFIEEHDLGSELDRLRLENGKYYILPGYRRTTQVQQWIYRRDLFETHDLGVPDTYEELFACLVFLKDIYPDATPITACWGGAHLLARHKRLRSRTRPLAILSRHRELQRALWLSQSLLSSWHPRSRDLHANRCRVLRQDTRWQGPGNRIVDYIWLQFLE